MCLGPFPLASGVKASAEPGATRLDVFPGVWLLSMEMSTFYSCFKKAANATTCDCQDRVKCLSGEM